jgi:hypothetical protein
MRPGEESQERLIFLEIGEDGAERALSWPQEIAGPEFVKSREKQVTASREKPGKRPGKSRVN